MIKLFRVSGLGSQIREFRQLIYDEESPLGVNNEIAT